MRLATLVCMTGLFILTGPLVVDAKPKGKGGVWTGSQYLGKYHYVVDTNAQICFAFSHLGGLTDVPCELLARIEEWNSIITWVPGADSTNSPDQTE